MKLLSQKMTNSHATEILNWRYPPPYSMYNQEVSAAGLKELLDQSYKAIVDQDGGLIGFYCTGRSAQVPKGHEFNVYQQTYIDIGLGMKPELTGKGFGKEFLAFILQQLGSYSLRLTVAKFNQRAISLYEAFEFKHTHTFTNGGVEFITMIRKNIKA